MKFLVKKVLILFMFNFMQEFAISITMKQFESSLDMMRSICAPKYKVSKEMLDNLRKGVFVEDQDLKCYTQCIAKMAGTLTRKGDVSMEKTLTQIKIIIPSELQQAAKDAFNNCHLIQQNYKESCDKVFYLTKCVYEFDPKNFKFP